MVKGIGEGPKRGEDIEKALDIALPESFLNFVRERGSAIVGGYPISGISTREVPVSVVELTAAVASIGRRFEEGLVVLSILGDRALWLGRNEGGKDAPLYDVPVTGNGEVRRLSLSFGEFVERIGLVEERFNRALQRVRNRKTEVEARRTQEERRRKGQDNIEVKIARRQVEGESERTILSMRAYEWHPRLIRFHDDIVALTAFRYNNNYSCLEIDAFFSWQHPRYQRNDPERALVISVLAEAYHLSGSLELRFTRDRREDKNGKFPPNLWKRSDWYRGDHREACSAPEWFVRFSEDQGVSLAGWEDGKVSHEEGLALWWRLLRLSPEARRMAGKIEQTGHLSKEALATVLSARIWKPHEANWLFENCGRPEAVLLGTDRPERWLRFSESVAYGRSALLASKMARKITLKVNQGVDPEERFDNEYRITASDRFFSLRCDATYRLPWTISEELGPRIEAGEELLLLSCPRRPTRPEWDIEWLSKRIDEVASARHSADYRSLLLSMESRWLDGIEELVTAAADQGVHLIFAPRRIDYYEDEVAERMARARQFERFPSRLSPSSIRIFSVPKEVWTSVTVQDALEDAETFARWIAKRREIQRARSEFIRNCQTITRVAVQDDACELRAELKGNASLAVQQALEKVVTNYPDVDVPIIPPGSVSEFRKRLPRRLRGKVTTNSLDAGLVVSVWPSYSDSKRDPVVDTNVDVSAQSKSVDESPRSQRPLGVDFQLPSLDPSSFALSMEGSEIRRLEKAFHKSLREGRPFNVSRLRPHLYFPDLIHSYLFHRDVGSEDRGIEWIYRRDSVWRRTKAVFGIGEKIVKPLHLRVAYEDASKGGTLTLFGLPHPEGPPRKQRSKLNRVNVGLLSMRHPEGDADVLRYLVRNREMNNLRSSADQERRAYSRTRRFVNCLMALSGDHAEAIEDEREFQVLRSLLSGRDAKTSGWQIHVCHTTGLPPATVGVYRAAVDLLKMYRGRIIFVPQIWSRGQYHEGTIWH